MGGESGSDFYASQVYLHDSNHSKMFTFMLTRLCYIARLDPRLYMFFVCLCVCLCLFVFFVFFFKLEFTEKKNLFVYILFSIFRNMCTETNAISNRSQKNSFFLTQELK